MGFGTPGADLQDHGGRLAAVLQVMAIALAGLETGAIAGVEHGFASIGDEHDRAPDNIDELVFVGVPMALTGPGTRAQLQQVDAELGQAGGHPEPSPGLVPAGFVERLGMARSGASAGDSKFDLHVPTSAPRF